MVEFGDRGLDSVQLAVRAAAFDLLLDSGQPAAITSIAASAGVDSATATEVLEGFSRTGNVSLKGGRVVGIAGLTVESRKRLRASLCAVSIWGVGRRDRPNHPAPYVMPICAIAFPLE